MQFLKIFILSILMLVIFGTVVAQAVDLKLAYPLPRACPAGGSCPTPTQETQSISAYIVRIYQFGVGIAGILAVGMIVFGAIYYTISAGAPDKQNEGKEYITSALWGLALLMGSYLILNTINPEIVKLKEPVAPRVSTSTLSSFGTGLVYNCPSIPGIINPTSCFVNMTVPSSSPNYTCPGIQNQVCTAINNATQACTSKPRPGNMYCVCPNCKPLLPVGSGVPGQFPIKQGACGPGALPPTPGDTCLLEESVHEKLEDMLDDIKNGGVQISFGSAAWRVTEAFPPVSQHQSSCHYNGLCFDFSYGSVPASSTLPFCDQLQTAIDAANNNFYIVLVESASDLLRDCRQLGKTINLGSARAVTGTDSTGFHLHIASPQ